MGEGRVVGAAAQQAWRQALTWLGGSTSAKQLYDQYLAQSPQDAEIQQLEREASVPVQNAEGGVEAQGYADLKRGNVAAAERQFASELRDHPDDAQALAGLGIVRMRQQRFGEARDLLGRAMRASPDNRKDWIAAYDSASYWATVNEAKALARSGNLGRAKALLTSLQGRSRSDNGGADLVLADVNMRLKDYSGAEQAYRRAVGASPRPAPAPHARGR